MLVVGRYVPVVDPVTAAVNLAEALTGLGLCASKVGPVQPASCSYHRSTRRARRVFHRLGSPSCSIRKYTRPG